jgi:hypothetical protein
VLVPRFSSTPVVTWTWPTLVVSRRRVLEVVFVLLEFSSPSRRILSAPIHLPLWFTVSVLHFRSTHICRSSDKGKSRIGELESSRSASMLKISYVNRFR